MLKALFSAAIGLILSTLVQASQVTCIEEASILRICTQGV
jgi:hypothetical protein